MSIFSHSPLISGSSNFLLSWSQVFVGARYYWRGWGGVGFILRRCGAVSDRFSFSLVFCIPTGII